MQTVTLLVRELAASLHGCVATLQRKDPQLWQKLQELLGEKVLKKLQSWQKEALPELTVFDWLRDMRSLYQVTQ